MSPRWEGPELTVFSIPVSAGFAQVEAIFGRLRREHPEAAWYFGNVYDTDGVTPLGWWIPEPLTGAACRPQADPR